MNKGFKITNFVFIKHQTIYLNGEKVFSSDNATGLSFLKQAYKQFKLNYPKFHKMDMLCKLGILGTEILFNGMEPISDTALVFSNSTASLDTDKKHRAAMKIIVSPAIFVYTLPNIVLGEISIKHQLQSENAFFVEEKFNAELLFNYSEALLRSGKAAAVVSGWIEVKNDQYDVFLCQISREGEIPFSRENLEQLYFYENE